MFCNRLFPAFFLIIVSTENAKRHEQEKFQAEKQLQEELESKRSLEKILSISKLPSGSSSSSQSFNNNIFTTSSITASTTTRCEPIEPTIAPINEPLSIVPSKNLANNQQNPNITVHAKSNSFTTGRNISTRPETPPLETTEQSNQEKQLSPSSRKKLIRKPIAFISNSSGSIYGSTSSSPPNPSLPHANPSIPQQPPTKSSTTSASDAPSKTPLPSPTKSMPTKQVSLKKRAGKQIQNRPAPVYRPVTRVSLQNSIAKKQSVLNPSHIFREMLVPLCLSPIKGEVCNSILYSDTI